MATITIEIADKDRSLFEQLIKRLNGKVIESGDDIKDMRPNATTIKAIEDARKGKTKKITDIDAFFASI